MRARSLALSAVVMVVLAACAPTSQLPQISEKLAKEEAENQRAFAIREAMRRKIRLARVFAPLRVANAAICGETKPFLGFLMDAPDAWPDDYASAFERVYGPGKEPVVTWVLKGSSADRAGLKVSDRILAVNGHWPKERHGRRVIEGIKKLLDEKKPVDLRVLRADEAPVVDMAGDPACPWPAEIKRDDRVNAFADGKKVYVTTGMLRFVENDDELALVLGHEMAHDSHGHIWAKQGNAMIGAIIGAVISGLTGVNMTNTAANIGQRMFSQQFEAEADYIGVYYAARAGFRTDVAADLWRRMAAAHPEAIHLAGSTHPSTAKRFIAIREASHEVESKRSLGQPLVPALKKPAKPKPEDDETDAGEPSGDF